ncbi:serine--tRNA ligase [Bauldia litoralis]|uniref:Serine--tRNA ligase n=1 Tax=Bauldia litoralis TaxID=665467 RepID=A0A1G6ATW6_9HYPH|nr:serine--tRNA ligase [Bauldia litoralis]SDB11854.1 seryl-tRNA synthetase [Bauldia litoralis]
MLDIKWIRENPQALDEALRRRNAAPAAEHLLALDEARRSHILKLEEAQARRNAASKEIGKAKGSGDEETAQRLMAEVGELKAFLQEAESEGKALDKALDDALAEIPNLPLDDVPVGADESDNVEYRRWGSKPGLNNAKEHFELGEALGQMDFETAAKLSGSRFVVLRKGLARLERALGQFMLDLHTTEHGYEEVQPPLLVRDEVMFGTGQLPKFRDDQFISAQMEWRTKRLDEVLKPLDERPALEGGSLRQVVGDLIEKAETVEQFWLIPTAEVPLTNLVRESILSEEELPRRFTALTPCFRSEAGAAGRDTRGMLRQHQFDKVELVSITAPEQSGDEHERLITCAEEVLKRLDIHFRTMTLSTGDMGFGAQKTYDIEAWLPGQAQYREISSCSVCGDFQARRMKARFRPKEGKGTRLVHTLNGSGVAVGRALIAVMENYQNPDGSITVPDVLRPYMGGLERIEA